VTTTQAEPGNLLSILERLTAAARAQCAQCDDGTAVLRPLIGRLRVAAIVAGNGGEFVAANAAATILTGYTSAELLRMSMWQITPGVLGREAEALWRAFLATEQQTGEYRVLRHDGRIVRAEYAARAHVLPGLHVSLLHPLER
jgi:PAS domain S-box-containing protein